MERTDLVRLLKVLWCDCVEGVENLEVTRLQQFKSSNSFKRVFLHTTVVKKFINT